MFKRLRRDLVRGRIFPDEWLPTLEVQPFYNRLSAEQQLEVQRRIQVFLNEKTFEGVGGLDLTGPDRYDEVRVTIAAQAVRLELGREPSYYPDCLSIFVYPSTFVSTQQEALPGGVVAQRKVARIGEAWHRGSVVLAWDAAQASAQGHMPGHNVTLHEFAHKLDALDGAVDGVPRLSGKGAHNVWQRVMTSSYRRLLFTLQYGYASAIDAYAATSPAEFFAVVTETFFESPLELRAQQPDLYALMRDFYGQDPAQELASLPGAPAAT